VKALKESKVLIPSRGLATSFFNSHPTPDEKDTAPFIHCIAKKYTIQPPKIIFKVTAVMFGTDIPK